MNLLAEVSTRLGCQLDGIAARRSMQLLPQRRHQRRSCAKGLEARGVARLTNGDDGGGQPTVEFEFAYVSDTEIAVQPFAGKAVEGEVRARPPTQTQAGNDSRISRRSGNPYHTV